MIFFINLDKIDTFIKINLYDSFFISQNLMFIYI